MVEQITRFLGLLGPGFCLASTLSNGDIADDLLDGIDTLIERDLVVVDPATLDFDAADERELQFQRQLVELCHVQDSGPDRTGQPKQGVEKRRQEAEEILRFFCAPWTDKWGLVHPCPPGCCGLPEDGPPLACANKAESVKRAKKLARIIFMPPISVPAATTDTKIDPCLKSVTLITWTFGLLRKAVGMKLGKKDTGPAAVGNIPEHVDADAAIGIPRHEIEHYRQMGNIRVNRVHTFLSHGYSKYMTLVWLVVTHMIMIVHYKLFKHGTFYSQRGDLDGINIFDFVGPVHTNPVAQAMAALVAMLLDPMGSGRRHLRLLWLKLGDNLDHWPGRVVRALQVSLLIGISVLWRKLYKFFKAYPWALAPAFDETRTEEARRTTLQDFFDASWCCLDAGLGRQLRAAFPPSIDIYCGTPLARFIIAVFTRLVVTSTQVELQFSRYSGLTDTRSKRLGLAGFAAKAMNVAFKEIVERWRNQNCLVRKPSFRSHPDWVQPRKSTVRAIDLFKATLKLSWKRMASCRV